MADRMVELNAVLDDARRWHQVRGGINDRKPHRRGGPLRMDTLGNCISTLEEYRGILNRLDVALAAVALLPDGDVIRAASALLESVRDGFPVSTAPLREIAERVADSRQHSCPDDGVRHAATEAKLRGSGWGTT